MSSYSHCAAKIVLFVAMLFGCSELTLARNIHFPRGVEDEQGALRQIKESDRVGLIVIRNPVVDANGSHESIVAEALRTDPRNSRRHFYPYRIIARKLNEYIRKFRGMNAADEITRADYIICFNLLEYRRTVSGFYPYGELFVILNRKAEDAHSPRVIWKTKRIMWAEDAVKKFLKELKHARGER